MDAHSIDERQILLGSGVRIRSDGSGDFLTNLDQAAGTKLSVIKRAFARWNRLFWDPREKVTLNLTRDSDTVIKEELYVLEGYSIDFLLDDIVLNLEGLWSGPDDEAVLHERARPFLAPRKHEIVLSEIWSDSADREAFSLRVKLAWRGLSLGDVSQLGDKLGLVMSEAASVDLSNSQDLLNAGCFEVFTGMLECTWLDAKRAPYSFATPQAVVEFCKDIASFANADGGIILLGFATSKSTEGDRITNWYPFLASQLNKRSYRDKINKYIYPAPEGVSIETVETSSGGFVGFIHIPPQPESLKPFLVCGGVVSGKHHDDGILIPVRVDDGCMFMSHAKVHGLLVAGGAYLAGRLDSIRERVLLESDSSVGDV